MGFFVGHLTPWEDDDFKMGRLEDTGEVSDKSLFSGKYINMGLRSYLRPSYKSSRGLDGQGHTPVYFGHSYISSRKWVEPPAMADRVWVYPNHAQVKQVRDIGGKRDRKAKCWYLTHDQASRSELSKTLFDSRNNRSAGQRGGTRAALAAALRSWQKYIERHGYEEDAFRKEVLHDEEGPISFGNLPGGDVLERGRFWVSLLEEEGDGRRVQLRIQAELPCEADPAELRALTSRFCRVFEERRLPYWAVVHLPHEDEGSDGRNVHLHVVYVDRPFKPEIINHKSSSSFADVPIRDLLDVKKDREARGRAWIVGLRSRFADLSAEVQKEAAGRSGIAPSKIFDARSYVELGIDKPRCIHLGRRRMALERAGIPTTAGLRNAQLELMWKRSRLAVDHLGGEEDFSALAEDVSRRITTVIRAGLTDVAATELVEAGDRYLSAYEDKSRLGRDVADRYLVAEEVLRRAMIRRSWAARNVDRLHNASERRAAEAVLAEADGAWKVIEEGMGRANDLSGRAGEILRNGPEIVPEVLRIYEERLEESRVVAQESEEVFWRLMGEAERGSGMVEARQNETVEAKAEIRLFVEDMQWAEGVLELGQRWKKLSELVQEEEEKGRGVKDGLRRIGVSEDQIEDVSTDLEIAAEEGLWSRGKQPDYSGAKDRAGEFLKGLGTSPGDDDLAASVVDLWKVRVEQSELRNGLRGAKNPALEEIEKAKSWRSELVLWLSEESSRREALKKAPQWIEISDGRVKKWASEADAVDVSRRRKLSKDEREEERQRNARRRRQGGIQI